MMKRLLNLMVVLFTLFSISTGSLFAQATATGAIQGTVSDSAGAVVVDAQVSATNKANGAVRTATSNAQGYYRFDQMPAGSYTVKVSKSGFSTYVENMELLVQQTATVSPVLKLGSAETTVEVTGDIQLIDQAKTSVAQEITPTEVEELPMIGRDVANLAYLAPGVKAADSYDPTKNRMPALSVNGQNGRNVNVTVNGVDNKDNTVGGPVMQLPLEAVQEFSISTQRFSAANGRSEGAAINMITKSGSNKYHGSAFGYFRDQALNKDEKDADGKGGYDVSNPPYSRQQFGGSFGGALVKDKVFGFFAFERLREHTNSTTETSALDQLNLLTGYGAQPIGTIPTPFFESRWNGRADWQINSKHSIYWSYNQQANDSLNDQADGTGDLTNGNFTMNHMQLANMTINSVLTPSVVNQFMIGTQYWNNLIDTKYNTPLITFPSAQFGTNTNVPQQSYQRKFQFKDDVSKTWKNHTFRTGFDYIWEPALGGFFKYNTPLEFDFALDPSDIAADPAAYPQGLATPGLISGISWANGDPKTDVPGGTKQLGLYFQDDWKVNSRLTLNVGLRWDRDFNMVGGSAVQNSRTYELLVAASQFNSAITPYIKKQPQDDVKNFSPRVGFALDLTGSGKHVLRGGYGLYYGNVFQNIPIFMEQQHNDTIFQSTALTPSTTAGDMIVPGFPGVHVQNFSFTAANVATVLANLPAPSSTLAANSTGRIIDPNYRNPVTEEFNFGYTHELSKSSVIEAEYVHVLSLHENKTMNINPKLPNNAADVTKGFTRPFESALKAAGYAGILASVRDEASIGRSRYDGLNISYRQRMSHHFSLNTNYTLARALSYGGGGTSFRNYPRDPRFPFAEYEFGPTPNDERHHVTLSGIVDLPKGFQFSPIVQFGSARPYQVVSSTDYIGIGSGSYAYAVIVPKNDPKNYGWALTQGTTAVRQCYWSGNCTIANFDSLRGDPTFQLDARLAKNFKLGEGKQLQLVAQAFNLTNRANYGNNFNNNIANIKTGTFGHPAGFINPSATNMPRALYGEFGFRFSF